MDKLSAVSCQLSAGQKVRVRWSGKTGEVLKRYHPNRDPKNGREVALVRLDAFEAYMFGPAPVVMENLECIYAVTDLEVLDG